MTNSMLTPTFDNKVLRFSNVFASQYDKMANLNKMHERKVINEMAEIHTTTFSTFMSMIEIFL